MSGWVSGLVRKNAAKPGWQSVLPTGEMTTFRTVEVGLDKRALWIWPLKDSSVESQMYCRWSIQPRWPFFCPVVRCFTATSAPPITWSISHFSWRYPNVDFGFLSQEQHLATYITSVSFSSLRQHQRHSCPCLHH